jgi:hypothetical protein
MTRPDVIIGTPSRETPLGRIAEVKIEIIKATKGGINSTGLAL